MGVPTLTTFAAATPTNAAQVAANDEALAGEFRNQTLVGVTNLAQSMAVWEMSRASLVTNATDANVLAFFMAWKAFGTATALRLHAIALDGAIGGGESYTVVLQGAAIGATDFTGAFGSMSNTVTVTAVRTDVSTTTFATPTMALNRLLRIRVSVVGAPTSRLQVTLTAKEAFTL